MYQKPDHVSAIPCDNAGCFEDACNTILLANGDEYYTCENPDCAVKVIATKATTKNPVHDTESW